MAKTQAQHQAAKMALPAEVYGDEAGFALAARVGETIASFAQRLKREGRSKEEIALATAFALFIGGMIVTEGFYPM